MISIENEKGQIIGDIEDVSDNVGEQSWFATVIDNAGNVLERELCITEHEAKQVVLDTHKKYFPDQY